MLHTEPGAPGRGHWIFDQPFSEPLRQALLAGSARRRPDGARRRHLRARRRAALQHQVRDPGADERGRQSRSARPRGPRRCSPGEAHLPYALLGFATDYANGVKPEDPTPVEELIRLVGSFSGESFPPRCSQRRWRTSTRPCSNRTGRTSPGTDPRPPAAVVLGSLAAPPTRGWTSSWAATARGAALRARCAGPALGRPVAPGLAFEATTLDAARAALHGHEGPGAAAAPDVPDTRPAVVADPLEDLAAGCEIALGAAHDARPYLLAVARPDPELLALVERSLDGGILGAFAERGVTLGMLRHERRLASAGDARALAIDPLAPPDLAALVRGRLPEPPRR